MFLKSCAVLAVFLFAGAAQAQSAGAGLADCGVLPPGEGDYSCACPSSAPARSVWGDGVYTADSDICTAARHSGLIGRDGGAVTLRRLPGQSSYAQSARNGVTTSAWGSYNASFEFVGAETAASAADVAACGAYPTFQASYDCACPAGGRPRSVWGSGPFTADSDICTAARFAGVIGAEGGVVEAEARPGQDRYPGGEANGVTTSDWGSYGYSFDFAWVVPAAPAAPEPVATAGASAPLAMPQAEGQCGTMPSGVAAHACFCPRGTPTGSAWGSGPYTDDSDICAAAAHAGAIGIAGGEVWVLRLGGLESYTGSTRNGITTSGWSSYGASITFNEN